MNINPEEQIGQIVARNYKAAAIFQSNGIDFCCRGNRTLQDAVREKGLTPDDIIYKLNNIDSTEIGEKADYDQWPLERVIDEIESNHHVYVRQQIPVISKYLDQIYKAHGKEHPVIDEIRTLFAEGSQELLQHMSAEEGLVFPMIREFLSPTPDMASLACVPLNSFQYWISTMKQDHENEGNRWEKIASIVDEHHLHINCKVAHVTFSLLREFKDDLHLHIHLENNILFARALELKNERTKMLQS